MGTTLMRTAYSTLIREEMDCSTALFDPAGQLVAQADHVPSHQGTLSLAAKTLLGTMTLEPGDVVIFNHPYRGGTHHPDIMIFKPVFHDGSLVALAGSLGHHLDVGGRSAGSISTDARDVFEEGLMIPPLKLYRRGVFFEEIFEMIASNIREPQKTLGDLRAQVAAVTVGERRFLELVARHGATPLAEVIAACLDNSERLMREDLRAYPTGRYSAEGFMDSDGISDEPVRIFVTVILEDVVAGPMLAEVVELLGGNRPTVIVLLPDVPSLAAREAGRDERGYGAWNIAELHRLFAEQTPRIGTWLDTSGQSPEETVEAILRIPLSEV